MDDITLTTAQAARLYQAASAEADRRRPKANRRTARWAPLRRPVAAIFRSPWRGGAAPQARFGGAAHRHGDLKIAATKHRRRGARHCSNRSPLSHNAQRRMKPLCALTNLLTAGKDRFIASMVKSRRAAGACEPRGRTRDRCRHFFTDSQPQHQERVVC